MCGLKFRRQYPIEPWIVDFGCRERMLVVEIDGGYHDNVVEEDAEAIARAIARELRRGE